VSTCVHLDLFSLVAAVVVGILQSVVGGDSSGQFAVGNSSGQ
jgi:hypothetical protein